MLAVLVLLVIFRLGSQASAGVALNDSVVWVEDGRNGRLLQINGSTREITAQVTVGEDNDSIVALPRGRDAVFFNRTTGVVGVVGAVSLSIDSENTQPGESGLVGEDVDFLADSSNNDWTDAYVVGPEQAIVVEPGTNRTPVAFSYASVGLGDTVVNAEGQLLAVTGDAAQVGVSSDNGLERLVSLAPLIDQDAAPPELVRAGDSVYVVDSARRVINEILDGGDFGETATVCGSPDEVQMAGNFLTFSDGIQRIVLHDSAGGTLSVTEPAAGECVVIDLEVTGDNFGTPVAVDSTAYLPNYDTGEIIIVDLDDRVVTNTFQFRPGTGRAFELEVFGGAVWANEADGFRAALVTADEIEPISKLGDVFVGEGGTGEGGDGTATLTGGGDEDGPRVFDEDGAVFGVAGEGTGFEGFRVTDGPLANNNEQQEANDQDAIVDDEVEAVDALPPPPDDAPDIVEDEIVQDVVVDDVVEEVTDDAPPDAPIVDEIISDEPISPDELAPELPADLPNAEVVVPVEEEAPAPVVDELVANFTFSADTINVGEEVRLVDDSTGDPTSWNWDFGDGTSASGPDVTKIWGSEGNFTVTLFIANAGNDLAEQTHQFVVIAEDVLRIPTAGFTLSSNVVEVGEAVTFTSTSTGDPETLLWEFGDGSTASGPSASHAFSEPGVYQVTLTASNAAGPNSVTAQVEVVSGVELPVAVIGPFPGVVEVGQVITFLSESENSPTSTSWDFGDGNTANSVQARHSFDAPGTYRVRLAVANSAGLDEAFVDIVVEPRVNAPVARFNSSSNVAIVGEDILFNDLSLNGPTTLSWDFGDGTTTTGANVSHNWDSPGTFLVTLTATNEAGSSTTSRQVTIDPLPPDPPTAAFNVVTTTVAANEVVSFTDTSTGSPTEWFWNFGDGETTMAQSPNHSFDAPGTYTVTLTASNPGGSTSTSQTITVTNPPTASFTQSIDELEVDFEDTSQNGPTAWSWDFGDGTSSILQDPDHTYALPGQYTVTLVASNAAGDSIPFSQVVTVNKAPVSNFSATTNGLTAQFTDLSIDNPTAWLWEFDDGSTSTLRNPSHTYASSGTYDVTLTVTNAAGSDDFTDQVTVALAPPVAAISCTVVGAGVSCDGSGSSSAATYTWSSAPVGTVVTGQGTPSATFSYTVTGDYNITLTVENTEGTVDSASQTVSVNVPQPPEITALSVVSNNNGVVELAASATNNPTTWTWNPGGGTITAGAGTSTPTITYTNGGNRTVTVTASNAVGTSAPESASFTITITPPDPEITAITATNNQGVVALSATVANGPVTYLWSVSPPVGSFDNPTSATPTLTVPANGTYTVSLAVDNGAGGTDSASEPVVVNDIPAPPPIINSVAVGPEGPMGQVTVSANVTDVATYNWSFPDSNEGSSTQAAPTFTFNANGTFNGTLTVANADGVTAMAPVTVLIAGFPPPLPPPPSAALSVALDPAVSTVGTLTFTGTSDAATATYAWTVDGVAVPGNTAVVSYDFANSGPGPIYTVGVTVTDAGGTDSASITAP